MAEALRLEAGASLRADRASAAADAPADTRSVNLAVPDMHCGGCMRKVEAALRAAPGVQSARVNLTARRASVIVRAGANEAEPLVEALKAIGFKSSVLIDDARPEARKDDDDYLKRLGVAGFAAANVMLLSIAVWSGHASDMPASLQTAFHWLSAIIAVPAVAYAGKPFFSSAAAALKSRRVNMDVPISLGVTLATLMSLYQTMRGSEQVYFDAAITLLFFLLIGRALDQRTRKRAASAAENLLGLSAPSTTVILPGGGVERIATRDVRAGMLILVAAGERVPVDARLARGATDIDESLITGESRPRHVRAGDTLYSGTVNLSAPIEAVATAVAENTLIAEIARLMSAAEQARGRYVRLADSAARLYAPAVHALSLATFVGWMLAGHGWEPALTAAIAVLIITCPCALALAVPVVQVVAAGRLLRNGVILKAPDGLERLAEVNHVVLDKTGTLTVGAPRLADEGSVPDASLALAARLAVHSRHPYAEAVVAAARRRGLRVQAHEGVKEVAGSGLIAVVDGADVRLGSARFCGVTGSTAIDSLFLKVGDAPARALPLRDVLRADAAEVVHKLGTCGYKVEILSGDALVVVSETAKAVGIADWRGGQRPDDKIRRIGALHAEGRKVLMVGDGLNDAPALAAGHASLSPSSAVAISQTAADAVIQGERLAPVLEVLGVAKAARRRALENFAIAIGYNLFFVPLAVAGVVTPLIAAIAMSASSIAVTANGVRLAHGNVEVKA